MTEREAFEKWWDAKRRPGASDMAGEEFWPAWQSSRKQALEDAAKACETLRDDAKEAESLEKFNQADAKGDERCAVSHGDFWLTVSTFNAGLKHAAAAIRSLSTPDTEGGKG